MKRFLLASFILAFLPLSSAQPTHPYNLNQRMVQTSFEEAPMLPPYSQWINYNSDSPESPQYIVRYSKHPLVHTPEAREAKLHNTLCELEKETRTLHKKLGGLDTSVKNTSTKQKEIATRLDTLYTHVEALQKSQQLAEIGVFQHEHTWLLNNHTHNNALRFFMWMEVAFIKASYPSLLAHTPSLYKAFTQCFEFVRRKPLFFPNQPSQVPFEEHLKKHAPDIYEKIDKDFSEFLCRSISTEFLSYTELAKQQEVDDTNLLTFIHEKILQCNNLARIWDSALQASPIQAALIYFTSRAPVTDIIFFKQSIEKICRDLAPHFHLYLEQEAVKEPRDFFRLFYLIYALRLIFDASFFDRSPQLTKLWESVKGTTEMSADTSTVLSPAGDDEPFLEPNDDESLLDSLILTDF